MAGKKRGNHKKIGRSIKEEEELILKEENKIEKEEKKIERLGKQQMESLENLKKEISKDVGTHPLTKITRSDIVRSVVGALIGTVGHFAFFYGVELADRITMFRATSLYVLSLVVGFFFMYYSGFRKVKEIRIFRYIPIRVLVIYIISLIVVMGTLFLFDFIGFGSSFEHVYKAASTTLLLAVLGASTADILGKE